MVWESGYTVSMNSMSSLCIPHVKQMWMQQIPSLEEQTIKQPEKQNLTLQHEKQV